MNPSASISAIRELLRTRFPLAQAAEFKPEAGVQTGVPCLDQMGMLAGCIHEIVCPTRGAGAGLILSGLLDSWGQEMKQPVALVDGADVFNPRDISTETRERLLWLRCRDAGQAVRGADLLLRDGNIPRVLMDLALCPLACLRKIPAQAWHRLRILAEKSGTLCCVFTASQTVPCVRSRLVLNLSHGLDAMDRPRTELAAQLRGDVARRGMGEQTAIRTSSAFLALAAD
jgi:hypothetical protein